MKLSLHRCTAGTVAVATALILPLLLGFGSLGIEVGHWYLMQRQMQGAADAAAISAAAQYIQDRVAGKTTSTAYQTTGQSYASLNGFTIPLANTCLITASGDNCGAIRALDARRLPTCTDAAPCMAVETITAGNDTAGRSSMAHRIIVCVPPPLAPVTAIRSGSTSGRPARKSSDRMLFHV